MAHDAAMRSHERIRRRHPSDHPPRLVAGIVMLCLVAVGQVHAQGVECDTGMPGHLDLAPLCRAIEDRIPSPPPGLRVEVHGNSLHALAARLSWALPPGRVAGPLIEISTAERPIGLLDIARLIEGVIAMTRLP